MSAEVSRRVNVVLLFVLLTGAEAYQAQQRLHSDVRFNQFESYASQGQPATDPTVDLLLGRTLAKRRSCCNRGLDLTTLAKKAQPARIGDVLAKDDEAQILRDFGERRDTSEARDLAGHTSSVWGALAVMGGVMFHLCGGSSYCLGNLILYMPENIRYWSNTEGSNGGQPALPDAVIALSVEMIAEMVAVQFGPPMEKWFGPKLTMIVGAVLMSSGVFFASYAKRLLPFVFFYAMLFGLGSGLGYQMPFLTGGRWFPESKGLVIGMISSAFGGAAFFWNFLDSKVVNPRSLNPLDGRFPPEVYHRWPILLRTRACILGTLALCGALLQNNPDSYRGRYVPWVHSLQGVSRGPRGNRGVVEDAPSEQKHGGAASEPGPVWKDVFTVYFSMLWLMSMSVSFGGLYLAGSYKSYGARNNALNNDAFLTAVGSFASLLGNAGGRLFWGALLDRLGFTGPFGALSLLQGVILLNFPELAKTKATFALSTILILFCLGGHICLFPAQCIRKFGANGPSVYGILFTALGCACFIGPILAGISSTDTAFRTFGVFSLISTMLSTQLPGSPINVYNVLKRRHAGMIRSKPADPSGAGAQPSEAR